MFLVKLMSEEKNMATEEKTEEKAEEINEAAISGDGDKEVLSVEEEVSFDDAVVNDMIESNSFDDDRKKVTKIADLFIAAEVLILMVIITLTVVFGYVLYELKKENDLSQQYLAELTSVRDRLDADKAEYEARRMAQMEENKKIAMFLEDEVPEEDNGFSITFGSYEQDGDESNGAEPIDWLVLSTEDRGILLISKYVLDCVPYNDTDEEVTWETSSIRKWLNDDFLNTAFTAEEKLRINTVSLQNEDNTRWGTAAGPLTGDKVFCLSVSELKDRFDFDAWYSEEEPDEMGRYDLGYSQLLIVKPTKYASEKGVFDNAFDEDAFTEKYELLGYDEKYIGRKGSAWWLRTPGFDGKYACRVNSDGLAGCADSLSVTSDTVGVRPAIYISGY